eukprot:m.11282 g.11282  ORF g.11282 m.11282 type:complete len:67 (+) comp8418_c0_seq2:110-310(+)
MDVSEVLLLSHRRYTHDEPYAEMVDVMHTAKSVVPIRHEKRWRGNMQHAKPQTPMRTFLRVNDITA